VLLGPHAFVVNAIEYPLDLASSRSPAKSPLPGHELLTYLPSFSGDLGLLLAGVLLVGALVALIKHLPRTPAQAARYAAIAIGVVTLLAPAARFGYLIYPVNLLVWAALLRTTAGVSPSEPAEPLTAPESAEANSV
jgi:hypothetical protein